jgi:hypothetical protein
MVDEQHSSLGLDEPKAATVASPLHHHSPAWAGIERLIIAKAHRTLVIKSPFVSGPLPFWQDRQMPPLQREAILTDLIVPPMIAFKFSSSSSCRKLDGCHEANTPMIFDHVEITIVTPTCSGMLEYSLPCHCFMASSNGSSMCLRSVDESPI